MLFLDLGVEGKGAHPDLSSKYVPMARINIQEQFGRAKIPDSCCARGLTVTVHYQNQGVSPALEKAQAEDSGKKHPWACSLLHV